MDVRHARDGRSGEMHDHRHAILLGRVADLLGLQNPAGRHEIRLNHIDRVVPAQFDEGFLQIDILAGENRDVDGIGDFLQKVGILPGDHVFEPREVVLFKPLSQPDAAVDPDVTKWSAESGMSIPTISRIWATYSHISAMPFSVISVPVNMC